MLERKGYETTRLTSSSQVVPRPCDVAGEVDQLPSFIVLFCFCFALLCSLTNERTRTQILAMAESSRTSTPKSTNTNTNTNPPSPSYASSSIKRPTSASFSIRKVSMGASQSAVAKAIASTLGNDGDLYAFPGDPLYKLRDARPYNLDIQVRPVAVAYPRTREQVAAVVRCAVENGCKVQARCGGHSYANYCLWLSPFSCLLVLSFSSLSFFFPSAFGLSFGLVWGSFLDLFSWALDRMGWNYQLMENRSWWC